MCVCNPTVFTKTKSVYMLSFATSPTPASIFKKRVRGRFYLYPVRSTLSNPIGFMCLLLYELQYGRFCVHICFLLPTCNCSIILNICVSEKHNILRKCLRVLLFEAPLYTYISQILLITSSNVPVLFISYVFHLFFRYLESCGYNRVTVSQGYQSHNFNFCFFIHFSPLLKNIYNREMRLI